MHSTTTVAAALLTLPTGQLVDHFTKQFCFLAALTECKPLETLVAVAKQILLIANLKIVISSCNYLILQFFCVG